MRVRRMNSDDVKVCDLAHVKLKVVSLRQEVKDDLADEKMQKRL